MGPLCVTWIHRLLLAHTAGLAVPAPLTAEHAVPSTPLRPEAALSTTRAQWPKYSSFEVAKSKLLYAVENCRGIDADNTLEARTNAATAAAATS